MVRHGDDQWFDIVKWVLFAMINAEELNITSKNIDEMTKSPIPVKRFIGTDGNYGEQLVCRRSGRSALSARRNYANLSTGTSVRVRR